VTTTIHQALHGYSDGHRQLACSASLTAKDARLTLIMSDVSGPGVAAEGTPYLTGYPLHESGIYAIAKTWPATDLPRPGCVWTHTLFIEFSDLAVLETPSSLCGLFREPRTPKVAEYASSLQASTEDSVGRALDDSQLKLFASFASAIYGHPNEQVWARRYPGLGDEDVVMHLWDQQFPRLRRSFKFCTLTSVDRSQEGLRFDLQLCPRTNSTARLRFVSQGEGLDAGGVPIVPWVKVLLDDARRPQPQLRKALRVLGADVLGGREAMQPICRLFTSIDDDELDAAVDLVSGDRALAASVMARTMVARAVLRRIDQVSQHSVDFVLECIDLVSEEERRAHASALVMAFWKAQPAKVLEWCFDERVGLRDSMRVGVQELTPDLLLERLIHVPSLAPAILSIRPDLAQYPGFWAQTQHWPSSPLSQDVDLRSAAVLKAMVLGLRNEGPIAACLIHVGALAILDCLQGLTAERLPIPGLDIWVKHACRDTEAVAHYLSCFKATPRDVVACIASHLHPDDVPNDFGDDPWFSALSGTAAHDNHLPTELLAFGFRRALGWRSRSVAQLLALTFEQLHEKAVDDAVPAGSWKLVEGALPWVTSDESWDKGLRLRRALAKRCIDLRVPAEAFCALVKGDVLFKLVLDEVWGLWGGPTYLKTVKNDLDAHTSPVLRKRRREVSDYIKQRPWW